MAGQFVAVKTVHGWIEQARDAVDELVLAGAVANETTLAELADIDYPAFCLLIEAMYALGAQVSQDILDRAQMRPVEP